MVAYAEIQPSILKKYFEVWAALCMLLGLLLSQYFPFLSITFNNMQIGGISIPFDVCLFLLICPARAKISGKSINEDIIIPET